MRETRVIMGMPITIEIVDRTVTSRALERLFAYFTAVDDRFSTYKNASEISAINKGSVRASAYSKDMQTVLDLCDETKRETHGYFDIRKSNGMLDPAGLVKGWAIRNAARMLAADGFGNFYVDAGSDIQVSGRNAGGQPWSIGIKNPFKQREIVKVVYLERGGIATSGTYIRGQHIWNPKRPDAQLEDVVSLTIVGPDVYEADRFATAAFAMGKGGIAFVESVPGLEGYMIDARGRATMTTGFGRYTIQQHPHAQDS